MKFLKRLKATFLNKKFIGFCAIGIINTFNTAFFSWLAHFKIQENISAHIGFFISLTINYILNSLVVFKSRLSLKKYLRFLISYIPNLIIYTLVSFITINLWQLKFTPLETELRKRTIFERLQQNSRGVLPRLLDFFTYSILESSVI